MPAKLQTTGDAVPIAEQVDSVRRDFAPGPVFRRRKMASWRTLQAASGGGNLQLTWFDRSGKMAGTVVGTAGGLRWPAISPDGNTVAVDRLDPQTGFYRLWLHDLARGTHLPIHVSIRSSQLLIRSGLPMAATSRFAPPAMGLLGTCIKRPPAVRPRTRLWIKHTRNKRRMIGPGWPLHHRGSKGSQDEE